jgi:hypothetical protein
MVVLSSLWVPVDVRMTAEGRRLAESRRRVKHWNRWGPYLAERAWGTVREDYSRDATPWEYFPHDHARSRAYRWNEDGLLGMCDRHQHICVALALWNGRDPFLKERLFGVTNPEGNHGEDVKECYFYLDNTPTHSYVKALYKYPQAAFPYASLVTESQRRGRGDGEYELLDTGVFEADRYFDVQVEYAKADAEDILIRYTVTNRGPDRACLDVLPTIWFPQYLELVQREPEAGAEAPRRGDTGDRAGRRDVRPPVALLRRGSVAALHGQRDKLPETVRQSQSESVCQRRVSSRRGRAGPGCHEPAGARHESRGVVRARSRRRGHD